MFCASMFVMASADVTGERVKTMETLLSHASRPYAARLHASKVPYEYANILPYFQYLDNTYLNVTKVQDGTDQAQT